MKMSLVTLETEERLILFQQVRGDRTMGHMAGHAVFGNRRVVEHKGPLLFGMTLETKFTLAFICIQGAYFAAMNLMAGTTGHLAFPHGVPRRQHHGCRNVAMTFLTKKRFWLGKTITSSWCDLIRPWFNTSALYEPWLFR
jgi:hypothetical protein